MYKNYKPCEPGRYFDDDILYEPGLEKDDLFSFLDISNVKTKFEEDVIRLNEYHYPKMSLYGGITDRDFLTKKTLQKFSLLYRSKNKLMCKLLPHYEVSVRGYLHLKWHEIEIYKFIRRNAITMYEEPIVILSGPEGCSKHFRINKSSKFLMPKINITTGEDWDDLFRGYLPVDIHPSLSKDWWLNFYKKERREYTTRGNKYKYLYATTYLAFLIERFYLKPNGLTLADLDKQGKRHLVYIPNNCMRLDKRASLSPVMEDIDFRNIGIFKNEFTKLVFECTRFDDSLYYDYPLALNKRNRWIYLLGDTSELYDKFVKDERIIKILKKVNRMIEKQIKEKNTKHHIKKYMALNIEYPDPDNYRNRRRI